MEVTPNEEKLEEGLVEKENPKKRVITIIEPTVPVRSSDISERCFFAFIKTPILIT